jgi:hypothetical protein
MGIQTTKKALLFALLIPLGLFEVFLGIAFLPTQWQHAIDDRLLGSFQKSHHMVLITHPALSQEIESALREHIGLRIGIYAITTILLIGNAWLIRWVCQAVRRI